MSLETELRENCFETEWLALRQHVRRDALIIVNAKADLIAVAKAVAENDQEQVKSWIADGMLSKPTRDQLDRWEENAMARFRAVIVQPFVLIEILSDGL